MLNPTGIIFIAGPPIVAYLVSGATAAGITLGVTIALSFAATVFGEMIR
jgi:hypothetical protein